MTTNWKTYKLGDLVELVIDNRGKTPKKLGGEWSETGVRALSAKNIKTGKIVQDDSIRFVDNDLYKKWMKIEIEKGDILVTSEAPFGQIFFWNSDEKIVLSQRLFGLRIKSNFCSECIYYFMLTEAFQNELKSRATGTTVMGLRQPELMKCEIRIPSSYDDQVKIASILSSIDRKIELNNSIDKNIKAQLNLHFNNFFVSNSNGWPEKTIGDFLDLERGLSYKGNGLSDSEGVPMLNLGNILPNSVFRPEKLKYYTLEYKERHIVKPGDIIVANTDLTQDREVLGSAIIVPDMGYDVVIFSHHISVVRNCKISKYFVYGLLNRPEYRNRVAGYATGTTVLALPTEALLNCSFNLPPIDLINKFDSLVKPMHDSLNIIRKESDYLENIKSLAIKKLFSETVDLDEVKI